MLVNDINVRVVVCVFPNARYVINVGYTVSKCQIILIYIVCDVVYVLFISNIAFTNLHMNTTELILVLG